MRVYELSKQLGIPNKELLDVLAKEGYEISTHMAALTPEALAFLKTHFSKLQPSKDNKSTPAQLEKTSVEKQLVQSTKSTAEHQMEKIHNTPKPKPSVITQPSSQPKPRPISLQQEPIRTAMASPALEPLILTPMTVNELAHKINKPVNEIILLLLKQGVVSAKNQLLPVKTIEKLAQLYGIAVLSAASTAAAASEKVQQAAEGVHKRSPVIVVIGHVDHGKTTLLDYIRKTRVASKEQGGITQHLGAYQVETPHGNLVFLDTPGHSAFTKIRARGVRVADLAVLVVAADDGIMPQTIEAIKHAKAVNVPIIVALNKIDKASSVQIDAVKRGLAQHDLLPEEWGGSVIVVPVSAKTGQGIDHLLEMLALQAELMELKTDDNAPVEGFVLEARMEKGRGPVATILSQQGTLKIGDYFVAGKSYGRVSSLTDSYGKSIKSVAPSIPVQVAGFAILPEAGDQFKVATQAQYAAVRDNKTIEKEVEIRSFTAEDGFNVIIKADTKSSKEAILGSLGSISTKSHRKIHIVNAAVGDISEGDITLAATTGAEIIGFHVKAESNAFALAQREGVTITLYQVIYKLLEEIEEKLKDTSIKMVSTKIGQAKVLKVFEIKNVGTIAGCILKEGRFARNGTVVAWRGNQKIGGGSIKSLERDRKSVKEVHAGFEFAFLVEGFNDWRVDDVAECFIDAPAEK